MYNFVHENFAVIIEYIFYLEYVQFSEKRFSVRSMTFFADISDTFFWKIVIGFISEFDLFVEMNYNYSKIVRNQKRSL